MLILFINISIQNRPLLTPSLTEHGTKRTLFDHQQAAIRKQFALCMETSLSLSPKFVETNVIDV